MNKSIAAALTILGVTTCGVVIARCWHHAPVEDMPAAENASKSQLVTRVSGRFSESSRVARNLPAFESPKDGTASSSAILEETKEQRLDRMTREHFIDMQAIMFALRKIKFTDRAATEQILKMEREFAANARRFVELPEADLPEWRRQGGKRRAALDSIEKRLLGSEQRFREFDQIRVDKFNELNLSLEP